MRVIRALHELGVEAVAVYSTADEGALHVRLADRAVRIGPAPANAELPPHPLAHRGCEHDRCDAVHPGYGFLAENDDVRPRVRGARSRVHRPAGERDGTDGRQGPGEGGDARGRRAARPRHGGRGHRRGGARAAADDLGYPVLLKATAGGGGRGMRLVSSPDELERRTRGLPPRPRRRSATAPSTSRRRSRRRGTSRSR